MQERNRESAKEQSAGEPAQQVDMWASLMGSSPILKLEKLSNVMMEVPPCVGSLGIERWYGQDARYSKDASAGVGANEEQAPDTSRDCSFDETLSVSSSSTSAVTGAPTLNTDNRVDAPFVPGTTAGTSALRFVCPRCERSFSSASHLRRHTRDVHQNVRKHGCDLCGMAFKRRQHLTSHYEACARRLRYPMRPDQNACLVGTHPSHAPAGVIQEHGPQHDVACRTSDVMLTDAERFLPPLNPVDSAHRRCVRGPAAAAAAPVASERRSRLQKHEKAHSCSDLLLLDQAERNAAKLYAEFRPPADWFSQLHSSSLASSAASNETVLMGEVECTGGKRGKGLESCYGVPGSTLEDRLSFFTNNSSGTGSYPDWLAGFRDASSEVMRARSASDPSTCMPPQDARRAVTLSQAAPHAQGAALDTTLRASRSDSRESTDPEMLRILDSYARYVCISKLFEDIVTKLRGTDTGSDAKSTAAALSATKMQPPMLDELYAIISEGSHLAPDSASCPHHQSMPVSSTAPTGATTNAAAPKRGESLHADALMAPAPLPTNLYTHIPSDTCGDERCWRDESMRFHVGERSGRSRPYRECSQGVSAMNSAGSSGRSRAPSAMKNRGPPQTGASGDESGSGGL